MIWLLVCDIDSRLIEYFPFVWLRHSRHLPLGYWIVSLYLFIKYKGQLLELHELWGQFQANLNLGWCLSLWYSSGSITSLPDLLNVSSQRHWLDWLISLDTSSYVLKFNLICFIVCFDWSLLLYIVVLHHLWNMATANVDESPSLLIERNIAYFKDTLLLIQCHSFNWEYEKVPRVLASMLIADLKRILKCAVFLKENRILLLTEELDLSSRFELHENLRKFVDIGFECRHFHADFTISHVGHYCDWVSIAAHVIVDGIDQSVLEDNIVYDFPQYEPDVYKYLSLIPKAHSTPNDRMQELVQAIEGLDLDLLQHIVGKAIF